MAEKILLGAARRRFLGGGAAALLLGCFASCGPSGAEAGESQAAAGDAAAGESQAPSGDERTQRKQRSEARLKAEGVPTLDHLPAIETAAEAKMRGAREVAERLLALTLVAVRAEGLLSGESPESARAMIDGVIRKRKAAALFTPKEKAFISALRPAKDDQVQFLWRYEAAWVLAWALR